ncbi:MAG: hypothetical protein M3Y66_07900 [Actinomycetota bacterium]|nr:hypothetical protein [Actinomycetota bacterium]
MLQRAAADLADVKVADTLAGAPAGLPATDTAAACADLARRMGAGVLSFADSVMATADGVAGAMHSYQATDSGLAASAASVGRAA